MVGRREAEKVARYFAITAIAMRTAPSKGTSIYNIRREGGGGSRNVASLQTNSIDSADKEEGGVKKISKFCGRHIRRKNAVNHSHMYSDLELEYHITREEGRREGSELRWR